MPLGVGRAHYVGLSDFCHILSLLPPGASVYHKHMSSLTREGGGGGSVSHLVRKGGVEVLKWPEINGGLDFPTKRGCRR